VLEGIILVRLRDFTGISFLEATMKHALDRMPRQYQEKFNQECWDAVGGYSPDTDKLELFRAEQKRRWAAMVQSLKEEA